MFPVPVSQTTLKTLYVFVEIAINPLHVALSIRKNFPSEREAFQRSVIDRQEPAVAPGSQAKSRVEVGLEEDAPSQSKTKTKLALVSTIQFISAVQHLRDNLEEPLPSLDQPSSSQDPNDAAGTQNDHSASLLRMKADEVGVWRGAYEIVVPQARPLSPGEVLGCTAPKLDKDVDALIYVGDGRFHLESIMIANPSVPAFRYDPYDKKFTREGYEHEEMRDLRGQAVKKARQNLLTRDGSGTASSSSSPTEQAHVYQGNAGAAGFGVVLGTLGRQGSLSVLQVSPAAKCRLGSVINSTDAFANFM